MPALAEVMSASSQLLRLVSVVAKRRLPNTWASELMVKVPCHSRVVLRAKAMKRPEAPMVRVDEGAEDGRRDVPVLVEPAQLGVLGEVADLVVVGVAGVLLVDPADVREPEAALDRRVGVPRQIAELVVVAVVRGPPQQRRAARRSGSGRRR